MTPDDVRAAAEQLVQFHEHFAPLFGKEPAQRHAYDYIKGLMVCPERKSIEPIALNVSHGDLSGFQKFIGAGPWPYGDVMAEVQAVFADELAPSAACILPKAITFSRFRMTLAGPEDAPGAIGHLGVPAPSLRKPTVRRVGRGPFANFSSKIRRFCSVSPKYCAKLWRPIRRVRNNVPRAGVLGAISQGSIPGVNIAQNTASRGYRGGVKRASPFGRARPSTLRPICYRRFSQTWGCYPIHLLQAVQRFC